MPALDSFWLTSRDKAPERANKMTPKGLGVEIWRFMIALSFAVHFYSSRKLFEVYIPILNLSSIIYSEEDFSTLSMAQRTSAISG